MRSSCCFKRSIVAGSVMLALSSVANIVVADEADALSDEKVERIIVQGKKLNGVSLVDLTDIQKKQANDLEDVFRGEAELTVGGSFAIAQKIYVRGIEDTQLNITVDGATQAGYLFHHQGRLSIEPEMLKQVEVKAGAGSALDGPGALGGAIRFVTKSANDLLDVEQRFGSTIKTAYFTNADSKKLSANFYGRFNDNWSGLVILGKNDGGNIKAGNGERLQNTKTEQEIGLLKLSGRLSETQRLELSQEYRKDDGVRNVRPHFSAEEWNRSNQQKSRRKTTTANYYYQPDNDLISIHATAYYTDAYLTQNENTDKKDGAGVKSLGGDIRNISKLEQHHLTYGIDYRKDEGYYINPSKKEDASVVGIYLQDHIELADDLSVSVGARYDKYKLDDADQQHYSASGISPNLSAIYQLTDAVELRAGYSTAIRGQKVKEAYLIGFRKNHQSLKEEKAKSYELAASYQENGVKLSAKAYVTEIENVVGTIGTRATGRFFGNVGDLKTKGITFSAAKQWQQLRIAANYSKNTPELDGQPLNDSTMGIGTSSGDTLTAQINYHFDSLDLELGWNSRLVKELTKVPKGAPAKAGFAVHDIYAEWYPFDNNSLSVNASINNVFDKHYYDHGTFGFDSDEKKIIGLPEAGRDFRLTLSAQF